MLIDRDRRHGPIRRLATVISHLIAGLAILTSVGCRRSTTPATPLSDAQSHQQMLDTLASIRDRRQSDSQFLGDFMNRQLMQELAVGRAATDPRIRWGTLYQLAVFELNQDRLESALSLMSEAETLLPAIADQLPEGLRQQFWLDLGVAYLRIGETRNCCQRNTPQSCILPIQGEGVHTESQWSLQAINYFQRLLATTTDTQPIHSAGQWLLNVSYMTIGRYPHSVPPQYLLSMTKYAENIDFPRFPNRAGELGLGTVSLAGSVIVDDFDNDQQFELIVSTYDFAGQLRYFRRNDEGNYVDHSSAAGLDGILGGLNMVQADYNNDGWLDLLVLRGGWLGAAGGHPNSLLRNNGDGTFTDVTFQAGLAHPALPTQTAAWADFDLDGDLDLFVGNESSAQVPAPCQLFENLGDGTFRDIASRAGVDQTAVAKAVVWGDYNGDRWPDLFVSNFGAANRLYRNNGDGTFTDVALAAGVDQPHLSFPAWFWDYNNDGRLDLFVGAYAGGIAEVGAYYAGRDFDRQQTVPYLFEGDGQGKFVNVSERVGLTAPHHPMGSNFGDLDNDGWLDFYLGTGWPDIREILPNAMYRNHQGEQFQDVTLAGGFGHLQKGHGVAFADLDGDGDQDIFEQMGGFVPVDRYYDAYFENPGTDNHWISVQLEGRTSNRSAIGTRLEVRFDGPQGPRQVFRTVSSGGSFGANPLRQHIGLGPAANNVQIRVFWPRTNRYQTIYNVSLDKVVKVVELLD